MTQYSLKSGIKKFQKKGEEVVLKELLQLHMRDTFQPQDVDRLITVQKQGALESLMFLKENRYGSLKGRACADGRKQQPRKQSCLSRSTIEAYDGRDAAVLAVPGSFLIADMDDELIMMLRGRLAELMVKTALNIYRTYITLETNNRLVLYVKLYQALYGCLRIALLFYLKLVKDPLESWTVFIVFIVQNHYSGPNAAYVAALCIAFFVFLVTSHTTLTHWATSHLLERLRNPCVTICRSNSSMRYP
jgi:hypothetical protein